MSWDWEKLKQRQQQHHKDRQGVDVPPQVDELIRKVKKIRFPGGLSFIFAILFIIVFFGTSSIFTVKIDEVGIIQRWGKYIRTCQPGLNFKLPSGIEKVKKVKIKRVYKEEFGFYSASERNSTHFTSNQSSASESLMLTGDLNVGVVPWIVQYRVKDPYEFLFKVKDVRKLLRDMAEASMRLVVGDRSINEVITKREELAIEAKRVLQIELDKAEAGLYIVTVEMKKTNVPEPVQSSFNEVNQAVQEKEKLIYQAKENYNKAIPAARGEADRVIKVAEGYALDRINRAKGDAARFNAVYNEYVKAKDVTKRRLYLEMIKDVLPKLGHKYIIDENQKNLMPLINFGAQNNLIQSGVRK